MLLEQEICLEIHYKPLVFTASKKKGKTTQVRGVTNLNDPLQELVVKFKEVSKRPGQFIQSFRLVPDPTIVLLNDRTFLCIFRCG